MEINGLFIAVLIIFAVLMLLGFLRGILGIVFGVASWVFFFVFVNWASPQVYTNLQGTSIEESIFEHVYTYLDEKTDDSVSSIEKSIDEGIKPEKLKDDIFSKYGIMIPEEFLSDDVGSLVSDNELVNSKIDTAKSGLLLEVTVIVTRAVLKGVSTVISAFIAIIICLAVFVAIKLIGKAPMLGEANRAVGLVFGAFEALMVVWLFMYVIATMATSDFGQSMMAQIDNNMILKFLYENNQILAFTSL